MKPLTKQIVQTGAYDFVEGYVFTPEQLKELLGEVFNEITEEFAQDYTTDSPDVLEFFKQKLIKQLLQ